MSILIIKSDVTDFLHAFSQIEKDDFHFELLSLFPVQCCEFASMLLARFLIEEKRYNFIDILMYKGQFRLNKDQFHLWLNVKGIVVDITAGQFEEAPTQIIIDDSLDWHDQWFELIDINLPEINFDDYLGYCNELVLEYDYQQILKKMND